jgi:hypothetical protein
MRAWRRQNEARLPWQYRAINDVQARSVVLENVLKKEQASVFGQFIRSSQERKNPPNLRSNHIIFSLGSGKLFPPFSQAFSRNGRKGSGGRD